MTFFSHRPCFSNFPSLLPDFPDLFFSFTLLDIRYRTQSFPHKKNTFFPILAAEKHLFLLFSYFRANPTALLLKVILGGRMHGPSPTSNFGDRPPSPPRFPPLLRTAVLTLI